MTRPTLTTAILLVAAVASAQPPERLGPVEVGGEHGTLGIGFGTQLRATMRHDGDADGRVGLRRARLFLRGRFLDDRVRFKLQMDLAPRSPELIDLHVDGRVADAAQLRFGIAKLPFTDHWMQSFLDLRFVDWPLTERWFGGGRQIGLTVFDPRSDATVSYALGIYSGEMSRPANGARFPRLYGERTPHRTTLVDPAPMGVPHPEVAGRVRFRAPGVVVAASALWDLRPTYAEDESLRLALDARADLGPLSFWLGGFTTASEDGDGHWMIALGGALAEVVLRVHPRVELAARYAGVVRSDVLRDDARRYAAQRIAAAPDDLLEDAEAQYGEVGAVRAEHELRGALSVFLVGRDLMLQLDAGWLRTAPIGDAFEGRLQLQVGF